MKQLKIILFACVLLLLGGCENDRTGYITKTFVSPSGEYQAEVVQVSLGATGGWSAVFFETDSGGSFPKEKTPKIRDVFFVRAGKVFPCFSVFFLIGIVVQTKSFFYRG